MVFGFGRIEFDGNFINLNRPWSDFQPSRRMKSQSDQADSGVEETLFSFAQWFINARLNLLDPQEKAQLQRLFEYAEDGSSFTLIRDYIPFEGGINPTAAPRGLKTIDDVDGTFTRTDVADSAWYLDEGTGLMRLRDGADVPRFPAGKYGAGIQIDGAAVNLLVNRISNAAWTKLGITAVTTTETLDPAGGSNVDKLTATAPGGSVSQQSGTPVGNNVATEFWLKSSLGNIACTLQVGGTTGIANTGITVTPIWQPFSFSADSSGFTGDIGSALFITNNGDIVYSWHTPQLFDNAQFSLGTVGPLSTSSITRNAEKLTFPSANIVNRDKGTVLMWVKPSFDPTNPFGAAAMFFESGDSAGALADVHIRCFYDGATADQIILQIRGDNIDQARMTLISNTTTGLTQDNLHLFVFTYDTTVTGGGHIFIDGLELTYASGDSNAAFNVSEVGDTFAIGSELDGVSPSFSVIDEVLILQNVLTANEIAGIHALGIGLGVPRNRWTVRLADSTWNPQWLHSDVYDIPLLMKEVLT